jgi:endogenous inhibitor of DNA gyrase (YacG/DUF329 family)
MQTTTDKVRALREANPVARTRSMAKKVGVSRQRVHQILIKLGLDTSPPFVSGALVTKPCYLCDQLVTRYASRMKSGRIRCSGQHWIKLRCLTCERHFSRRLHMHRSDRAFCTKRCQGKWLGTHYGRHRPVNRHERQAP